MAVLEPALIRCGLVPGDTWTMTIGEMLATIRARGREKSEYWKYLDVLNGQNCMITFLTRAPKANVAPKDFMITKKVKGGGKYGKRTRRTVGRPDVTGR